MEHPNLIEHFRLRLQTLEKIENKNSITNHTIKINTVILNYLLHPYIVPKSFQTINDILEEQLLNVRTNKVNY